MKYDDIIVSPIPLDEASLEECLTIPEEWPPIDQFDLFGHVGYNNRTKEQATMQTLKTLTATKPKASFSDLLTRASHKGERIVIKKGARPMAVVLGYEDFQRLADLEDRFESALLTKSLKEDRFLTLDEVTKRLML